MIQAMLAALIVVLVATAVVLIRKYTITQDRGLLWLVFALVIWPLIISPLVNYGVGSAIESCVAGKCVNLFPFTFVEQGRISMGELVAILQYTNRIIGASFGLIAVAQLYRSRHRNRSTPQPVAGMNGMNQKQKNDESNSFVAAT